MTIKNMKFDYFYGEAEAEQFAFYRIPKILVTGSQFADISTDAKMLYGLMLDRLQLSIRNHWMDEKNRVYIVYTIEEIMADMHCANQKAVRMLSELEKNAGIIERKRQGQGKPSMIYVLKFYSGDSPDNQNSHFKKCENHISKDVKTTSPEMWKSHGNNTDTNNTDNNDINPLNQHPADIEKTNCRSDGMDKENEKDKREAAEQYFKEKLDYEGLLVKYPSDHGRINEIFEILTETVCSSVKTYRVAGENRPAEVIKSRFMKLETAHIEYVMDCFYENTTKVRNIKNYMMTMLYNAPLTIDHYYRAKWNNLRYDSS